MTSPSLFAARGQRSAISMSLLVLLLAVLLPSIAPRLRHPIPLVKPIDFAAYYSAALLVREGKGALIYKGADTGTDPQKLPAPLGSPIDLAARSQGFVGIEMYLYPPLLADGLAPLTYLPLAAAARVFLVVDVLCLLGTAVCLIVLLDLPWLSSGSLILLVATFCFSPCIGSLMYGQITIVLLFLWSLGTVLYARGYPIWSAVPFALAAALKVTPVLVLLPFLLWKQWSWIKSFLACLAGTAALACLVNTPHTLGIFFGKIAPSMSRSIPEIVNNTLNAGSQMLLWALTGHAVEPDPAALPPQYTLPGKLVAYSFLASFLVLLWRKRRVTDRRSQVLVLALFGLVAPLSSPVSWEHAYTTSLILLVVLWHEGLRTKFRLPFLTLLCVCSVILDSYVWRSAVLTAANHGRSIVASSLQFGGLAFLAVLVLWTLARLRQQPGVEDGALDGSRLH